MATLKTKVYNQQGQLVDITSPHINILNFTLGRQTPDLLNAIPYYSPVYTDSLFELTKNLIENDIAIDKEKNAMNSLINQGVLSSYGKMFDLILNFDETVTEINKLSSVLIGPGNIKISTFDINNVFEVKDNSLLMVPAISELSYDWYRRDLIVVVFYDDRTNKPAGLQAPYLKYVHGTETYIPDPPFSLNDIHYDTIERYGYYPLYQVLVKNTGGKTEYLSHYQIFELAGLQSVVHLFGEPFEQYIDDNNDIVHGLFRFRSENIHCTTPDAVFLSPEFGHSKDIISLDGGSLTIAQNDILLQTPDIKIQAPLNEGSILTFPFSPLLEPNQFYPRDNITLTSIEIATENFDSPYNPNFPSEGLELHLQTARYYVNPTNNGVINITNVIPDNANNTLQLSLSLSIESLTRTTFNNTEFFSTSSGVQFGTNGDFILVIQGSGKNQISKIRNILNNNNIIINKLPFALDETSKILIFRTSTIQSPGAIIENKIDGTLADFFVGKTQEEIDWYKFVYQDSRETATSALKWNNTFIKAFEATLPTIAINQTEIKIVFKYPVRYDLINQQFEITSIFLEDADQNEPLNNLVDKINHFKKEITQTEVILTLDSNEIAENFVDDMGGLKNVIVKYSVFKPDVKYYYSLDNSTSTRLYFHPYNSEASIQSIVPIPTGYDFEFRRQGFTIKIINVENNIEHIVHEKQIILQHTFENVIQIVNYLNFKIADTTNLGEEDLSDYIEVTNVQDVFLKFSIKDYNGHTYGGENHYLRIEEYSDTAESIFAGCLESLGFTYSPNITMLQEKGKNASQGFVRINFPFNIILNYQQWYFISPSIFDDGRPLIEYGNRPKIVTANTASNLDHFTSYIKISCNSIPGKYPEMFDDKVLIRIDDIYDDINRYSITRSQIFNSETDKRHGKYIIQARCLTEEFKDFRIPPHRSSLGLTDVAICYLDITNGLISFHPGDSDPLNFLDSEIPENGKISCYYNNVFSGSIEWSQITKRPMDYGTIRESLTVAEYSGQNVFNLQFEPISKASINVYINGKYISSDEFDLQYLGSIPQLKFHHLKTQKGSIVSVKGVVNVQQITVPDGAVSTPKILNGAVSNSKIGSAAVTSDKLNPNIVLNQLSTNNLKINEVDFIKYVNKDNEPFAIIKHGIPKVEITEIRTNNARIGDFGILSQKYFHISNLSQKFHIWFSFANSYPENDPKNGTGPQFIIDFTRFDDASTILPSSSYYYHKRLSLKYFVNNTETTPSGEMFFKFCPQGSDPNLNGEHVVYYNIPNNPSQMRENLMNVINAAFITNQIIETQMPVTLSNSQLVIRYKKNPNSIIQAKPINNPVVFHDATTPFSYIPIFAGNAPFSDSTGIEVVLPSGINASSSEIAQSIHDVITLQSSAIHLQSEKHIVLNNVINISCYDIGETANAYDVNSFIYIRATQQGLSESSNTNEYLVDYGKFEIGQIFCNQSLNLNVMKSLNDNIAIKAQNNKNIILTRLIPSNMSASTFQELYTFDNTFDILGVIKTRNIITNTLNLDQINMQYQPTLETAPEYLSGMLPVFSYYKHQNNIIPQKHLSAYFEFSQGTGFSEFGQLPQSMFQGRGSQIVDPSEDPNTAILHYGKFISHRIYNAVWNDIAEAIPSDGTADFGDLIAINPYSENFITTKFNPEIHDSDNIIGVNSENPGMIVGYNPTYDNQIFVALKGMVDISTEFFMSNNYVVGETLYYINDIKKIVSKKELKMFSNIHFTDCKIIGTIIKNNNGKYKIFV